MKLYSEPKLDLIHLVGGVCETMNIVSYGYCRYDQGLVKHESSAFAKDWGRLNASLQHHLVAKISNNLF